MADEIKQDAGGFRPSRREFGGLVAAAVLLPDPGRAESRRQITAFVPFPAGGSLDSLTRIVTQKIAEQGSEAFVVENRAGANGTLGARAAIQSEPDGRAWLFGHDALLTVNDSLYHKQPGFDAQTEIKVAAALAQSPSMLVVHPAFGPKTIKEFVEYGKQTEIQYASGGIGSAGHLTMEYFGHAAGLKLRHIPYRGGAPAMTDLIGGQVSAAFVAIGGVISQVQDGSLRALGVSTAIRAGQAPNIPTVAESGYPGFEFVEMYFVFVNAKTPQEAVSGIEKTVHAALADAGVQAKIGRLGIEPVNMSAEAATAWLKTARETKAKLIADIGITPQ